MAVVKEKLTENERALLQFWKTLKADRTMPERKDLVPEELFPWIGYLHLLEPIGGGRDFRYVVFTTRTLLGKDRDLHKRCVSNWDDERAGFAMRLYGAVMEHARPIYSVLPERHKNDWVVYSRICLPLGSRDKITHILAMLSPHDGGVIDPILPTVIED
ncbi:PAS domain-containing protein [Hwanghaeella grinnelliae]|uniref:PAS domain-containing protein n=1 Tax=Hwanghaeella grinnelliae TaxID=2500179 RepID=A0A437QUU2_9PROT|nr:PAS domain-containing protein [Hwanghaeella grinnelliae]RVU38281.1 PAS domain-containing protein [Hwanghaeella grinnelliae]